MKVLVKSILGNKHKEVTNWHYIENLSSVEALNKMVVCDKTCSLIRKDGKEVQIVYNGTIQTEVFNQKQLLVDWANMLTDEFPLGGQFAKSSI
jgi:hypothetical protein